MSAIPSGAELIAAERRRQLESEGWSIDHDRQHGSTVLAQAAAHYKTHGLVAAWPFDNGRSKLKSELRNLIRAGALYQAAADVADPFRSPYHYGAEVYLERRDSVADRIDELIRDTLTALGMAAS